MLLRYSTLFAAIVAVFGCGVSRTPPADVVSPAPQGTPRDEARPAEGKPHPVPQNPARTPAPRSSNVSTDQKIEADSAADEAVLEELAAARPAGSDNVEVEPSADGTEALTNTVTWDIDVETYSDHDRVQYYLDFFGTKGRERMGIWLNRMTRYEPMIRDRLRRENLPEDLVYLALIESGFSNTATSRAKAVGMWQFMKGTAKHYGLRIDSWVDERRDPWIATAAAARHLRDLTRRFGSVYLAAAAYNAGAGRVSRGLGSLPEDEDADSLTSDATFFRLYDTKLLHRETKDYVPKLIAAARIAKEPTRYGFNVTPEEPVAYDSVIVPDMTGLEVIARLADMPPETLRDMNRHYLRMATPPGTRSVVRLPVGRGASTTRAYAALPAGERVTAVEHKIRRGETLSGIARKYKVSQSYIVQANPRVNPKRILAGQVLVIPTGGAGTFDVASDVQPSKKASPRRTGETKAKAKTKDKEPAKSSWHRVRRGETLSGIAEDYGVSMGNLRTWNSLSGNRILTGQKLRVTAPSRTSKRKPKTQSA